MDLHLQDDEDPWKLRKVFDDTQQAKYAVLLATGAMNPIHIGHVEMMVAAKRRIEKAGYKVLHAWISPSHDLYVKPKARSLNAPWLSSAVRVHLTELAVQDYDWLSCGTWESGAAVEYWPDYSEVADHLRRSIQQLYPEIAANTTVFYVSGKDHVDKCGLRSGLMDLHLGVVGVSRESDLSNDALEENLDACVFVAHTESSCKTLSSGTVRDRLKEGKDISDIVPCQVADFLMWKPVLHVFKLGKFDEAASIECDFEFSKRFNHNT
eukprot:m.59141 g.59141  ORF g.59141 m.59141 type:complete len:266 (-) comp13207_c0_seq2:94-891(-)